MSPLTPRHIPAAPVISMTKRGNGYGTECESLKKVNGGRCIKARAQRHADLHGVHRGGDIAVCTHHQGNGFVRQRHRAGQSGRENPRHHRCGVVWHQGNE